MRKKQKIIRTAAAVLLTLAMLTCMCYAHAEDGFDSILVSAKSAVLYDTLTGTFLYEKNSGEPMLIASTTKVMTALVVIEHARMDETVEIGEAPSRVEGSRMYVQKGDEYTVEQLLYGLLLMSGNDAALALAEHVGGSVEQFVALMNETAGRLGLSDTHFENPHGLDGETHRASAADLARLAAYALDNPDFYKIASAKTYQMPGRSMKNHNKLLFMLDGADGVKTGFTKAAGRCLISSVTRMGRRMVAVTLSAPDDWNDHIRLYSTAFADTQDICYLEAGAAAARMSVVGAAQADTPVYAGENLHAALSAQEYERAGLVLHLAHFEYAPVYANSAAGRASLMLDGREIASVPLYYLQDLPALPANSDGFWENLIKRLANFLGL